jgi:hypothetical protein
LWYLSRPPAKEAAKPQWKKPKKGKKPEVNKAKHIYFISSSDEEEPPMAGSSSGGHGGPVHAWWRVRYGWIGG